MKPFYILGLAISLISSCNNHPVRDNKKTAVNNSTRIYSSAVADSFSISISLPAGYDSSKQKYPVVFLLDANLYFDVFATMVRKYAEVGLAPDVIIAGIGYRDFMEMDSLRNRDYTYPVAIPEYEMAQSGGAQKLLSFINGELVPSIHTRYKTDTSKTVLMGHSLGGYFTCYALQQALLSGNPALRYFVAASPSLHYNNYYLLQQFKNNNPVPAHANKPLGVYIGYGGLEDNISPEDSNTIRLPVLLKELDSCFKTEAFKNTPFHSAIFSHLDHMETQMPIFLKGLNQLLATN